MLATSWRQQKYGSISYVCRGNPSNPKICDCIIEILTLVTWPLRKEPQPYNRDRMQSRIVIECTDVSISALFL